MRWVDLMLLLEIALAAVSLVKVMPSSNFPPLGGAVIKEIREPASSSFFRGHDLLHQKILM